jgi:hypothetical protein
VLQVARIIYDKNTKKFIPNNSELHVETCTYNIRQEYEEIMATLRIEQAFFTKKTKKFIPKNLEIHVETCPYEGKY